MFLEFFKKKQKLLDIKNKQIKKLMWWIIVTVKRKMYNYNIWILDDNILFVTLHSNMFCNKTNLSS